MIGDSMTNGVGDSMINGARSSMICGTGCDSGWIDFNSRDHPTFVTREAVLGLMRNVGYIGRVPFITLDTLDKA